MTTIETLGLSVALLVNAGLIVWNLFLSARVRELETAVDDVHLTAHDAKARAIVAARMADITHLEVRP